MTILPSSQALLLQPNVQAIQDNHKNVLALYLPFTQSLLLSTAARAPDIVVDLFHSSSIALSGSHVRWSFKEQTFRVVQRRLYTCLIPLRSSIE